MFYSQTETSELIAKSTMDGYNFLISYCEDFK
jgi:hypothetical protein